MSGSQNRAIRRLQIGAGLRNYKSGQERLQIGAALNLIHALQNVARGISNRDRDYKSMKNTATNNYLFNVISKP